MLHVLQLPDSTIRSELATKSMKLVHDGNMSGE
jgi:hypothetical protein